MNIYLNLLKLCTVNHRLIFPDSYRQSRIKQVNPRRRFDLYYECFVVRIHTNVIISVKPTVPALESWRPPGCPPPAGDGSGEGAVPPPQKIFEFFT